jgi:hypothetical protein
VLSLELLPRPVRDHSGRCLAALIYCVLCIDMSTGGVATIPVLVQERCKIAKKLGCDVVPIVDWVKEQYTYVA